MSAPIPEGHRTTATSKTGDEMEIAISCQDANRIIAALEAQVQTLRKIKSRLDHRLNERLCEMKPEYDDSITGFNEAWDIARELFAEVDAALAATEPEKA